MNRSFLLFCTRTIIITLFIEGQVLSGGARCRASKIRQSEIVGIGSNHSLKCRRTISHNLNTKAIYATSAFQGLSEQILSTNFSGLNDVDNSSSNFDHFDESNNNMNILLKKPPGKSLLRRRSIANPLPLSLGTNSLRSRFIRGRRFYSVGLRFELPNEEQTIRTSSRQFNASCFEESCRNLLIAAYFYLEVRSNLARSNKLFEILVKKVESSPVRLSTELRSTIYYWYARSMIRKFCDTNDLNSLMAAEHLLKREIERGVGCLNEHRMLLADIMQYSHHDYEAAALLYDRAIEEGAKSPIMFVNFWRLKMNRSSV